MATLISCSLILLYLIGELTGVFGVIGVIAYQFGDFHAWVRTVMFLPGVVAYAYSTWSTFQRNTKGIRNVARAQLLFVGCLLLVLPFLWLFVARLCEVWFSPMLLDDCTPRLNESWCQGSGVLQMGGDTKTECTWVSDAQPACQPTLDDSGCEHTIDEIEYIGIMTVICVFIYVAWLSHSYALEVESGVGKELNQIGYNQNGSGDAPPPPP